MTLPRLREPVPADAVGVTRLIRRTGPLDDNSHYAYLLLCHHFNETCAVAESSEGLVGFVSAYRPPRQPDTVFVWQIAVAEEARGQGLAMALLEEILSREACADVRYLEATVSPSNKASQALFRSLARRRETDCVVTELFPEELFAGAEQHEAEELYRIGPFRKPPGKGDRHRPFGSGG
jgi:L-2,4-diaminobutyric acid acetyltransferase